MSKTRYRVTFVLDVYAAKPSDAVRQAHEYMVHQVVPSQTVAPREVWDETFTDAVGTAHATGAPHRAGKHGWKCITTLKRPR